MPIPALPPPYRWGAQMRQAHHHIKATFIGAARIASQEESDPVRLGVWISAVDDLFVLVDAMENDGIPEEWAEECKTELNYMLIRLRRAASAMQGV